MFPVGKWLLYPLENRYLANPAMGNVDGNIVLSGAEDPMVTLLWDQTSVGGAAERDLAFMTLAKKFSEAKLVFTGGAGSMTHQEYKTADVARRLFDEQGMNLTRITFERESRNTWKNAILSKKLMHPANDERWVLITTAGHMPRSAGVFCQVEWEVIPYPVDFRSKPGYLMRMDWGFADHLSGMVTGVKEWIGLIAIGGWVKAAKKDALQFRDF